MPFSASRQYYLPPKKWHAMRCCFCGRACRAKARSRVGAERRAQNHGWLFRSGHAICPICAD